MIVTSRALRKLPPPGATWASIADMASRRPMMIALSPDCSRVLPRGIVMVSPRLTATITTPRGRFSEAREAAVSGEPCSRRYSSSWTWPPAKISASIAPGAAMMRSMAAASCASGQMTRSTPKCSRRLSPPPTDPRKSSRDTKQTVLVAPRFLAMEQATMFTSSSPVQAMARSHDSTPPRRSTAALVPLPSTKLTSSEWKRSVVAGS